MERPSLFSSALWAVLFAAVCAWLLAGLRSEAGAPQTAELAFVTVLDSAELEGVAIRCETSVSLSRGFRATAESGSRIASGGQLAVRDDGSVMAADGSNLYFDSCDGYEYLGPEEIQQLSVSSLARLLKAQPEGKGDGRLVRGFAWYYAALCDYSDRLPSSGDCRVQFEGFSEPVRATVLSLSAPKRGKAALLLRLTAGGEYLCLRKTAARLIFSEYSGLSVPREAIRSDEDGNNFVYVLSSGAFKAERVDILYTDADRALVSRSSENGGLREGMSVLIGDTENGYS